ncbi:MAG: HD domain-containing protein [Caldilineaceae bacterium]
MMETLRLLQHVGDLKVLPRTGWLFAGVSQPESIADHSYATIWTALLLSESINQDWHAQRLTAPLNLLQVMQIALVHDLAESILTDLPKRSTDLIGKSVKHQAEATAMEQLLKEMPNGTVYIASWHAYTAGDSAESRVVRDADKLEMLVQALRYEASGQRNLQEFWEGHQWFYPASEALWRTLLQQRSVG